MARSQTAEELKSDYIRRMGKELGGIHYALYQELSWLYVKWEAFDELYGSKPSRIDLLNNAAPLFFRIIQDTLRHDIIIHIARLTDSAKSVGKDNLTIQALPNLIKDVGLRKEVEVLVNEAISKTQFVKEWRNKRIAHNDLSHALQEQAAPLTSASRERISIALKSIAAIINVINRHYVQCTIMFDATLDGPRSARELVTVLDEGLNAKAARKKHKEW